MFKLQKKRIVLYAILAMLAWSWVITTYASDISSMGYFEQFAIVSIVGYAFPSIIIGRALSPDIKKIAGAWFFLAAVDLIFPPLQVNFEGVFAGAGVLFEATPDKFLFELWKSFGLSGNMLFFAVYPVSFIIMVAASTWLLTQKQLWQLANGGG